MRYHPNVLFSARKLADAVRQMYPEPQASVDAEHMMTMLLTPAQREELLGTMKPWLSTMYGYDGSLLKWTASKTLTAGVLVEALIRFYSYTATVLELSQLATAAGNAIRTYGWLQGEIGAPDRGFCLIGAISYVHQTGDVPMRIALLDSLRGRLQAWLGHPEPLPLSVWNDAPGREVEHVLRLLDDCALDLVTV